MEAQGIGWKSVEPGPALLAARVGNGLGKLLAQGQARPAARSQPGPARVTTLVAEEDAGLGPGSGRQVGARG